MLLGSLIGLVEEPLVRVGILPLGRVQAAQVQAVKAGLTRTFKVECVILEGQPAPKGAFYAPRQRYRAEKLLDFLDSRVASFDKIIGVVQSDISTTYRNRQDWGIMGLGRLGGRAGVVSTYRLRKKGGLSPTERLRRVASHELGHTLALEHCPNKRCVMVDGGGTIASVDGSSGSLCRLCKSRTAPRAVAR